MKNKLTIGTALIALTMFTASAWSATGEELFTKNCAACHPNGGNSINPKRTLHKKDMAQEGIKNWQGIVKFMRQPGPGMTKFDSKTISDKDAKAIAEYILKTFK
jgi:cytochrome c6